MRPPRVKKVCRICGFKFETPPSIPTVTCSMKCGIIFRSIGRPKRTTRYQNLDGYWMIYKPENEQAKKHLGWMYEHRFIMEQHIGRALTKNEVVHHIDRDRGNNSLSNLELITRSNHMKKHWAEASSTEKSDMIKKSRAAIRENKLERAA